MENERLFNSDEIQTFLDEINARRNELNLREQFILKIMSSFLAVLFVIFGYAFKEGIDFVFLLIPAFLASGVSLILHQERIIYSLAAYISNIEEEVNHYLKKDCLKWEKVISHINSDKQIQYIDGILQGIVMFPIFLIYVYSLYFISQIYNNEWYFPFVIGFYILYLIIIFFLYFYFGTRKFYNHALQIIENNK